MKYITGFLMFLWDFVGGVDSPELTAAAAILIVLCLIKVSFLGGMSGVYLMPIIACLILAGSTWWGKQQELKAEMKGK